MSKLIKVKAVLMDGMLATRPADDEIYSKYVASKAPDAPSFKEEVESRGVDDVVDKAMCVFSRSGESPFMWDYHIKGFFKEICGALRRMPSEDLAKTSLKIKAYKKVIDSSIAVFPRKIFLNLPDEEELTVCERPLRAETPQGERVALAASEEVPAGTTFEFQIMCDDSHVDWILDMLDFGQYKGLGQWRNSGKGRFSVETEVSSISFRPERRCKIVD